MCCDFIHFQQTFTTYSLTVLTCTNIPAYKTDVSYVQICLIFIFTHTCLWKAWGHPFKIPKGLTPRTGKPGSCQAMEDWLPRPPPPGAGHRGGEAAAGGAPRGGAGAAAGGRPARGPLPPCDAAAADLPRPRRPLSGAAGGPPCGLRRVPSLDLGLERTMSRGRSSLPGGTHGR